MFAASSLLRVGLSGARLGAPRTAFVGRNVVPAAQASFAMKSQTRKSSRSKAKNEAAAARLLALRREEVERPVVVEAEARPTMTVVDHYDGEMNIDPLQQLFVVAQFPGRQHKLVLGDQVNAARIPNAIVGEPMLIADILCVGSQDRTVIGRPLVRGASVTFWVEEQTRDEKLIIFKRKRRNRNQSLNGHKRRVTILRVVGIDPGPDMGVAERYVDWYDRAMDELDAATEKRDAVINKEKEIYKEKRKQKCHEQFLKREAWRAEQKGETPAAQSTAL